MRQNPSLFAVTVLGTYLASKTVPVRKSAARHHAKFDGFLVGREDRNPNARRSI